MTNIKEQAIQYASEPKHWGDWAALSAALGAFMDYLPSLAALASIFWIAIQAYYFIKNQKAK